MARRNPHMKLAFLGANNAYAFVMGESIVRMDGDDLFFPTKRDAKDSARRHGLKILPTDDVVSVDGEEHIPVPKQSKKMMGYAGKRMRSNPALRTVEDVRNDPRVSSMHQEDDGFSESGAPSWWVYLEPGWYWDDPGLHTIHETKIKDVIRQLTTRTHPCPCDGCQQATGGEPRSNPGVRTWGRAIVTKNLLGSFRGGRWALSTADAKRIVAMKREVTSGRKAEDFLKAAAEMIGAYGVEAIRGGVNAGSYFQDHVALYINTGDTYEPTILYDTVAREMGITTMGDFVEVMGEEYEIL